MNQLVSYAEFESALAELGFRRVVLPSANIMYLHEETETHVVVPPHKPKELVPIMTIVGTRKILDERGVVERDAWDRILRAHAA